MSLESGQTCQFIKSNHFQNLSLKLFAASPPLIARHDSYILPKLVIGDRNLASSHSAPTLHSNVARPDTCLAKRDVIVDQGLVDVCRRSSRCLSAFLISKTEALRIVTI